MNPAVIGIISGLLTAVSSIPQLVKLIRKKEANDLAYGMMIVLLFGLAGWVWYGLLKEDLPVMIFNGFSFLVNGLMLIFTIKYKK